MHYCEAVNTSWYGEEAEQSECGAPAPVKHHGVWLCEAHYEAAAQAEANIRETDRIGDTEDTL